MGWATYNIGYVVFLQTSWFKAPILGLKTIYKNMV
jgi:hypothetical protein